MEKQRIHYLDIAKGILILLLVFAHFRSAVIRVPFESPYFELVYGWNHVFTCFYMPAFFIISGLTSNFQKPYRAFLNSLIKSLLLPLFTLILIDQLMISVLYGTNLLHELCNVIQGGFGMWFLQALIVGKLIVYGLKKINWGGHFCLVITLLLLIVAVFLNQYKIGNNPCYYQHGMIASFWIEFGYWLKEHKNVYERILKWSLVMYPIVFVMTFFRSPSIVAGIYISMATIPLHIFYTLFGTLFLLYVCRAIDKNRIIEYWGRNSLVVYGLHFTPLLFLLENLWQGMQPDNLVDFLTLVLLLYLLEYIVCWLIMVIFQYKPLKYLIGKF